MCDVALVVGADKMFFPDQKEQMFRAFLGSADVHMIDSTCAWLAEIGRGVAPDEEADGGASVHSFFMDYYAGMARMHMRLFGTTQRQLAAAAAKNHFHSTLNPLSQYRNDMSVEQGLADQPGKRPLTRSMCAPVSDGAAAAVVCHERGLDRFHPARAAGGGGL